VTRTVLRRGREAVVVVQAEPFDRMTERAQHPGSLVEFFRSAPTGGKPLDLTRKRDATRTLKWSPTGLPVFDPWQ